eukprot:gene1129-10643_t
MFDSSNSQKNEEEDLDNFQNRVLKPKERKKSTKKEQIFIEKDKIPNEPEIDQLCIQSYKKMTSDDSIHFIIMKINLKKNYKLEIQSSGYKDDSEFDNFLDYFSNEPCYAILNFNFKDKGKEKKRFIFLSYLPEQCQVENFNFLYDHLHFDFLKRFDKLMIKMISYKKEDADITQILNTCLVWEKNFYSFFDEEN